MYVCKIQSSEVFLLHAISNFFKSENNKAIEGTSTSFVLTNFVAFFFFQDTVNAICDDEDIRAVSFVGSNTVSNLLYADYFFCFIFSV